jgi:hypothetical protein
MSLNLRMAATAVLALLALAACQPIPHPFDDARALPPPSSLTPPDSVGILVLPPKGAAAPFAGKLAEALAKALRDEDVPASTDAENRGSYRLETAQDATSGPGRTSVHWTLVSAKGTVVGSGSADAVDTADDAIALSLAKKAAPAVADLVMGDAPIPTANVAVLVALAGVSGAPGDGGTALARAISVALGRAGVTLGAQGAHARFALNCQVDVVPAAGGKQLVTIHWVLAIAGGKELGRVNQQNTVPAGSLEHAWGEVAYDVAGAAAPSIAGLLERAQASSAGS